MPTYNLQERRNVSGSGSIRIKSSVYVHVRCSFYFPPLFRIGNIQRAFVCSANKSGSCFCQDTTLCPYTSGVAIALQIAPFKEQSYVKLHMLNVQKHIKKSILTFWTGNSSFWKVLAFSSLTVFYLRKVYKCFKRSESRAFGLLCINKQTFNSLGS